MIFSAAFYSLGIVPRAIMLLVLVNLTSYRWPVFLGYAIAEIAANTLEMPISWANLVKYYLLSIGPGVVYYGIVMYLGRDQYWTSLGLPLSIQIPLLLAPFLTLVSARAGLRTQNCVTEAAM
ncbi:MAG: hypothetical protein ACREDR_21560 [Blastocatellia bacterium]